MGPGKTGLLSSRGGGWSRHGGVVPVGETGVRWGSSCPFRRRCVILAVQGSLNPEQADRPGRPGLLQGRGAVLAGLFSSTHGSGAAGQFHARRYYCSRRLFHSGGNGWPDTPTPGRPDARAGLLHSGRDGSWHRGASTQLRRRRAVPAGPLPSGLDETDGPGRAGPPHSPPEEKGGPGRAGPFHS